MFVRILILPIILPQLDKNASINQDWGFVYYPFLQGLLSEIFRHFSG